MATGEREGWGRRPRVLGWGWLMNWGILVLVGVGMETAESCL